MTTHNVFTFRLAMLQNPISGDRLDQFGAEDLLGPFDDLLDAAQRTQTYVTTEGSGRIKKERTGTARPQDPQREFIGAIDDIEMIIVEDFVRRLRRLGGKRR